MGKRTPVSGTTWITLVASVFVFFGYWDVPGLLGFKMVFGAEVKSPIEITEFQLILNHGKIKPSEESWLKPCGDYFFVAQTVEGTSVTFSSYTNSKYNGGFAVAAPIQEGLPVKIIESRPKPIAVVRHIEKFVVEYTIEMSAEEYSRSPCLNKAKSA